MREMIKPTLSLFIICLVVSFCLAFVNGMTKDAIEQRTLKDAEEQRSLVLSGAESFKPVPAEDWKEKDESGLIQDVYAAYKGEDFAGYVFNAASKGYGGEIGVTVGVGGDAKITGVKIGNNSETPGLGAKTAGDDFTGQYIDKDLQTDFVIVKRPASEANEIQAVSGATISSAAVTKAVGACAALGNKLLQELDGGEAK